MILFRVSQWRSQEMLSEVKKVKINGKWLPAETAKSTAELIDKVQNLPVT
ncbi:MAG: hypothetical protein LBR51_08000 [Bacteroidales bacterium]|nr:hypothetical protein [Bacteroidales bacterium]